MELTYTVLQVQKGALLYECDLCGCVVFHTTIHDLWHRAALNVIRDTITHEMIHPDNRSN